MFDKARLRLTAYYLGIIMLVSLSFSIVIYRMLDREIQRFSRLQRLRIEQGITNGVFGPDIVYRTVPEPAVDPDLIAETRHRLVIFLAAVNSAILAGSGILGFYLAGKTLEPIQEMMDRQYRFVSDASHELKTPLTAMRTDLEVTLRNPHLKLIEARQALSENLTEVISLQSLSENLLELSNGKPLDIRSIKAETLIKSAVREIKPLSQAKKIRVEMEISPTLHFLADELAFKRALVAVLDNAVKYSSIGGQITLVARRAGKNAIIAVSDRGMGIAPEEIPLVTGRFYRADKARNEKGYGLGLSIVDKIMHSLNGSLAIKSKIGRGTTVTLKIPSSA